MRIPVSLTLAAATTMKLLEPRPPDPPPPPCKCYVSILHSCFEMAFSHFDNHHFNLSEEYSVDLVFDFAQAQQAQAHDSSTVRRYPHVLCFSLQNRYLINPCRSFPALNLDGNSISPLLSCQPHGFRIRLYLTLNQSVFILPKFLTNLLTLFVKLLRVTRLVSMD